MPLVKTRCKKVATLGPFQFPCMCPLEKSQANHDGGRWCWYVFGMPMDTGKHALFPVMVYLDVLSANGSEVDERAENAVLAFIVWQKTLPGRLAPPKSVQEDPHTWWNAICREAEARDLPPAPLPSVKDQFTRLVATTSTGNAALIAVRPKPPVRAPWRGGTGARQTELW